MVAKADISVHARAPSGTGHYLLCEDPVLGVSTQSITEVTCPKCLAVLAEYADDQPKKIWLGARFWGRE
jgi:hypothetical protein